MPITLNGSSGVSTPGVASTDAVTGTTATFSGNVTANGLTTELRPLVLGTAVASTSGNNIDFTGIPSWVKRITVIFNGVSGSGTAGFAVQLGDSGGIETTGYVAGVSSIQGTNTTSATSATTAFVTLLAGVAAATYSGTVTLNLVSGNTWVCSSIMGQNNGLGHFGYGNKTLSDTLTQIRITAGADTFDAGSINVMYE